MFERLRARNEWRFFAVLPRAGGALALAWWVVGIALAGTYFVYVWRSTRGKVDVRTEGHSYH